MARINNWTLIMKEKADFIVSEVCIKCNLYAEGERVRFYEKLVPWGTIGAYLIGVSCGGRPEFEGEMIHTSKIAEYGDGFVRTESGSVYELGEKSADYVRFEKALANNVLIITNWALGPIDFSKSSTNPYFMQGKMRNNEREYAFIKEVKYQNLEERIIEFVDGTTAFIDYYAANPKQASELSFMLILRNFYMENKFCNYKEICIFDNVNWYYHCGALPISEENLLKYRKDYKKESAEEEYRYFVISADDMAMDMSVSRRMNVAKEVEA